MPESKISSSVHLTTTQSTAHSINADNRGLFTGFILIAPVYDPSTTYVEGLSPYLTIDQVIAARDQLAGDGMGYQIFSQQSVKDAIIMVHLAHQYAYAVCKIDGQQNGIISSHSRLSDALTASYALTEKYQRQADSVMRHRIMPLIPASK